MGPPPLVSTEETTLTLFVAGDGRRTHESIVHAQRLADEYDELSFRIIDIMQDPGAAEAARVLVAPSLVLGSDGQHDRIVVGDLPPAAELAKHLGLVPSSRPVNDIDRDLVIARIWDSNPDGIVVLDSDGVVCFLNEACERIFGRPARDLIGMPLDFHLGGDGPTELEIPRNGDLSTVELRTASIVWQGRPAVVATLRDVTEQKRMIEDLQHARAELARSNEDLERFAEIAAHDLKSPLTVITGATQLLDNYYGDASGGEAKEVIETITRSVARMTRLLEAVLQAAHAGADLDLQLTDVGGLVRDATAVLANDIEEVGATLEVGPMPTLPVDPVQITELFQNLLANAIKYRSPERPLRMEVSAEQTKGAVVFAVSDNGIGIEPADRDRVFTMLARLPNGRRRADGHGIGLSICRRVVERHGGRIWVADSSEGTTFKFTLPR